MKYKKNKQLFCIKTDDETIKQFYKIQEKLKCDTLDDTLCVMIGFFEDNYNYCDLFDEVGIR